MRHGAAVSFRFSFSVAEGVVWARRVAAKEVERQHHRGRGVTEFVTLESAVWRTDPALSRNLKPPPLGGGVFTLSLIHISEPTRQAEISYAVFCLKKKNK